MQAQLVFGEKKEIKRLRVQNDLLSCYEDSVFEQIFSGKNDIAVLDIGCNDGIKTVERFSSDSVKTVIGLEYNSALATKAQKTFGNEKFSFYHCDVEADGFSEKLRGLMKERELQCFDVIYLSFVLMHLSDVMKLLYTLRSFLKEDGKLMIPARSLEGVDIMSANLLLDHDTDPVIWRGPVIAGAVKQFWTETLWKDVDYMFVDMPPGTGDVPLTVFQSLPVDGIIIVTSPQELVGMIVAKAVNMAKKMNVPILGIVENMSYLECPDCGKHINVFGESHTEQVAEEYGLKLLAQIPIDPKIAQMVDGGQVEYIEMPWFEEAVKAVENL